MKIPTRSKNGFEEMFDLIVSSDQMFFDRHFGESHVEMLFESSDCSRSKRATRLRYIPFAINVGTKLIFKRLHGLCQARGRLLHPGDGQLGGEVNQSKPRQREFIALKFA